MKKMAILLLFTIICCGCKALPPGGDNGWFPPRKPWPGSGGGRLDQVEDAEKKPDLETSEVPSGTTSSGTFTED